MFSEHLRPRRCEAALLFESLGIPQTTLADALGLSTSSVSRVLQGRQPAPPGFAAVLRVLVGDHQTRRILTSIPKARR